MGKGGKGFENGLNSRGKSLTWDEVGKHTQRDDTWIVIHGKVYDISNFQKRHPGGGRVIGQYGGQDATVGLCTQV